MSPLRKTSPLENLLATGKRAERSQLVEAAEYRVLRVIKQSGKRAERVLRLLTLLRQAEQLRVQLYKRGLRGLGTLEAIKLQQQGDSEYSKFVECLTEINLLLKQYRWTPKLGSPGFYRLDDFPLWQNTRNIEASENWAVRWLLFEAQKGAGQIEASIMRFRQCEECQNWFYAKTDHARFCSSGCKKKFHSRNPEFKEKRALYMRKKRREEKQETEQWWQKQNGRGYKKERTR